MSPRRLLPLAPALLLLAAPAARAQTASPAAAPNAPVAIQAPTAPVNDEAAQDRIMALVRQRKCGPAKAEATRVGDLSLAEQIETMCGARSSNPFPTKSGGGKGGGGGGGRRGGGPG